MRQIHFNIFQVLHHILRINFINFIKIIHFNKEDMNIIFSIYFKDENTGKDIHFDFIDDNQAELINNLTLYLKNFGAILNIDIISEFGMTYFKVNMNMKEKECSFLEKQSPIFKIENHFITFLPPFLSEYVEEEEKIEEIIEFSDFESDFFDLTTKKPYSLWFIQSFDKPIHFYTHTYLDCKKNCCHIKVLEKNVNINKIKLSRPFYDHNIIGLELLDNLKELSFDVSTFLYPSVNKLKLDKLEVGYLFMETITCPIKKIIFCEMHMCKNQAVKEFNFISNLYDNYPSQFVDIEKNKKSDIFNRIHITKFVRILNRDNMYINDDIEFDIISAIEDFIFFIEEEIKMNEDKQIDYLMNMLGVVSENIKSKKLDKLIKSFQKKNEQRLTNIIENNYNKDIISLISSY